MSHLAGVWIDHGGAEIVHLSGRNASVRTVKSHVEGHRRATGHQGVPLPAHTGGGGGSRPERHREEDLRRYYDQVCAALQDIDELLILGPGEAPQELRKRLLARSKRPAAVIVRASDRLTERQLVAEVRRFFSDEADA